MSEILGFVYDHNVSHDIQRDCSAKDHDQDGDNDDSKTKSLEVPLDSGTQNMKELVHWVVDSSKV
jgi:hypothetical protein